MSESISIKAIAIAQAKADGVFEGTSTKTAQSLCRAIGTTPSFEHWESVRLEYVTAYQDEAKCSPESATKAWSRLAVIMSEKFGLEKPKAATVEAERKAEERKASAAKAQEFVAALPGKTTAEKLAACATIPKASERNKALALILKADADAAKASAKEADSKRKELAKRLAKRLADADYETLLAVEKVLDKAAKA